MCVRVYRFVHSSTVVHVCRNSILFVVANAPRNRSQLKWLRIYIVFFCVRRSLYWYSFRVTEFQFTQFFVSYRPKRPKHSDRYVDEAKEHQTSNNNINKKGERDTVNYKRWADWVGALNATLANSIQKVKSVLGKLEEKKIKSYRNQFDLTKRKTSTERWTRSVIQSQSESST